MAIDNTPPRLSLIITIAAITIVTLVSLNFVFESYYAVMSDNARREKMAPTTELEAQHKAEQTALPQAKIDQAMADLAKGSRAALITPQPSEDNGPLIGWSKMSKPAPPPPPHPMVPVVLDAHLVAGDAGAAAVGDAGAKVPAADAGAPKPKH